MDEESHKTKGSSFKVQGVLVMEVPLPGGVRGGVPPYIF